MKEPYLEVTYRHGRAVAAYYYLPREVADRSARTERVDGGLLVDYTSDGRAIGVEITAPSAIDLSALNDLLTRLGQSPATPEDLAPLSAA